MWSSDIYTVAIWIAIHNRECVWNGCVNENIIHLSVNLHRWWDFGTKGFIPNGFVSKKWFMNVHSKDANALNENFKATNQWTSYDFTFRWLGCGGLCSPIKSQWNTNDKS